MGDTKYYKDFFDFEKSDFKYKEYVSKFGRPQFGVLFILLVILGVFLYYSYISIMNIIGEVEAVFASYTGDLSGIDHLIETYRNDVIVLLFVAIFSSYFASVLALRVLKGVGAAFLWILSIISSLISVFLIIQIRVYLADQGWLFWTLIFISLLPIFLLLVFWKNLKIAARLINLTAEMLMKNKRIFINGVIYGILLLGLTVGIAAMYIDVFIELSSDATDVWFQIQSTDFSQSGFIIGMTTLYYFLGQFSYNFYYGGVIAQAHGFYRGKKIGTMDGFRIVVKRVRAILIYSAFSTIIYMIQWFLRQLAKKSKDTKKLANLGIKFTVKPGVVGSVINQKSPTQRMANWAIKLLEKLWFLINFYTLPAIVVENLSATKAITKSSKYVRTKIANLYVRKTAVRHMFRFTTVLMLLIAAATGAALGILLKDYFGMSGDETTLVIVFSTSFLVVAGIPAWLMSKNLDVVYLTFLYCFSYDKDLEELGFKGMPSRFYGIFSGKSEKKPGRILSSKKRKAFAYFGTFLGLIGMAAPIWCIYLLYVQTDSITAASSLNAWLESISYPTGYSLVVMLVAGIAFLLARRKVVTLTTLISGLCGVGAILYINYFRPVGFDWGPEIFDLFQMLVMVLEIVYALAFLVGLIAEAAIIGQEVNAERDERVLRELEGMIVDSSNASSDGDSVGLSDTSFAG
ncbi:MAG: hypothetical protein ACTSUE_06655 [Promethearchaeota archaeon]